MTKAKTKPTGLRAWFENFRAKRRRARAKKAGEFRVYQREDGDWGWAFHARNGEKVFWGEGYTRPVDAKRSIGIVAKAAGAPIIVIAAAKAETPPAGV